MAKKNKPAAPAAPIKHDNKPVMLPPVETEGIDVPETDDPDIIPDDDGLVTPPYEAPEPGEGP